MRITVPATALAQAIRNPARQARVSRLIRQAGTDLVPLDGPDATAVGLLLARTGTSDIVDAHVVVCAQRDQRPRRSQANRSRTAAACGVTRGASGPEKPQDPPGMAGTLPSDGDDSDFTAGSSDKSSHVVRVACENHRILAKGYCHHNGVNDIRSSALA